MEPSKPLNNSGPTASDAAPKEPTYSASITPTKSVAKALAADEKVALGSSKKSKSKKKKASNSAGNVEPVTSTTQERVPDKSLIETREEMIRRLKHGTQYRRHKTRGLMIAGTIQNPGMDLKTVTFPDDEIGRLLKEVYEIKQLLFCRLLLSHAAFLPAALRAKSVEEFLADEEVTPATLRDLCLRMESPDLQEIRDACADLFRSDEEENKFEPIKMQPIDDEEERRFGPHGGPGALPDKWLSKRDKIKAMKDERAEKSQITSVDQVMGTSEGGMVNFGVPNQKSFQQKIKVTICGRSIWNYPSSKAMTRKGWLQFCIIAKDSRLEDAVGLCRHWDEFYELNILACWHYFPGANWADFVRSRPRQQMLQLVSFTPYPMPLVVS
jgi:hypothetical protein